MHNAPSVSYPVGRFVWPHGLLGLQAALSLTLLGLWAGTQPIGLPWCVAVLGCAVALALEHKTLRGQGGWLSWDGAQWRWQVDCPCAEALPGLEGVGEVKLVWDGQSILLLRWQPLTYAGQPGMRWLWLGRSVWPQNWPALRRAVWMQRRSGE